MAQERVWQQFLAWEYVQPHRHLDDLGPTGGLAGLSGGGRCDIKVAGQLPDLTPAISAQVGGAIEGLPLVRQQHNVYQSGMAQTTLAIGCRNAGTGQAEPQIGGVGLIFLAQKTAGHNQHLSPGGFAKHSEEATHRASKGSDGCLGTLGADVDCHLPSVDRNSGLSSTCWPVP